ncbi:MAG: response regulator transcription factor [Elusimicrobia bacterium]|nr:response regulator transcription factor [Elusimicrobiota bacterium]
MARILSIEDDPSIQQVISMALNLEGHEVDYAFSGEEGYQKIFSKRPDLVILDMMLPGMTGADVLKALHTHPDLRGIPVLVMTAYGGGSRGSVLEQTVRALGAVEYLQKPFRVAELNRRVKSCLASRPPTPPPPGRELGAGDVRLDTRLRSVVIGGRHVATLAEKRFELLAALVEADAPVSREDLIKRLWGSGGSDAALEKTVSRLRTDLGEHSFRLRTTAGGYDFVSKSDQA